jgi:hypothetical protein
MLAMAVLAGEQVAPGEIVESMASALSLYNLATLASRDLDRVKDCYTLWHGVHTEFEALCQAWESVPQDGELIGQHRAHLCRLLELSADRCELYTVTDSARREHAKCRESELRDPEPHSAVLKDFTEREVAHIDAALNRRLHSR